jgi:hypothetical protein
MNTASSQFTGFLWLIWSNEHSSWWAPDSKGYTRLVRNAGRYTFGQALQICHGACFQNNWTANESNGEIPNEVMVPSPELISQLGGLP